MVVTRYFGGTLLGTAGLVRAYTKAAQQAVADAGVARMTACDLAMCAVAYNKKTQVEALIAQHGGGVDELEFGADLLYTYYTPGGVHRRVRGGAHRAHAGAGAAHPGGAAIPCAAGALPV